MANRVGAWVAGGTALIALALSLLVLGFGRYEPGITLVDVPSGLIVADVAPYSPAARDGIRPGAIVVSINGTRLYELPYYEYPEVDPERPEIEPTPVLVGPSTPTPIGMEPELLVRLAQEPIGDLELASPSDLDAYTADTDCCVQNVSYPGQQAIWNSSLALLPGLAVLLFGIWWLDRGLGGESLRPLAVPIAAATATPLLVQPVHATYSAMLVALAGMLVVFAMAPLGFGLAQRIEVARERQWIQFAIVVLVAVGAATSVLVVTVGSGSEVDGLRWAVVGAIPLLPGLAAAGPVDLARLRGANSSSGSLMQSTELALAGATPFFALGTDRWPFVWPLAVWLGAIAVAGRFTIRPLARLATRAQLQRDLVVAATEAERARVAADIHDEALQELTLLVRRLESAGDTEGAELGRTIADRLRAICGDLRLPILDDLGVGPALDWLVVRIERLAGGEVRLELADGSRPPPDVELAVFRIAQEALANAVKHGRPPIVVRYRATDTGVSLSIDDAGPGIAGDAGVTAERAGRFGLLNMQQRAEQIGAILDIRRWPTGGTHVALEWRPR
jgi:signal transduction histidine kinase